MNWMTKIWISVLLLSLAPFSFALAGPSAISGKPPQAAVVDATMNSTPRAVFPETTFKSASVFEGTEIKHDFVVENKGEAPLIINKIQPD